MRYDAYPAYKPSGVEWLGEVPEHWSVERVSFVATVRGRLGWKGLTADEYVPDGYVFLSTPDIKGEGLIDFEDVNFITAERYFESPEIMLQVGDVLVAKDGSTLGITNVIRHLPAPATVNSSIAVIRPCDKLDSRFLFRWFTSAPLRTTIHSLQDGQGVPHLFQADIKKLPVILPALREQRAIADFLDAQTGRIDALVVKKHELIEKLKEKRTALISRTVTRGLPPEAARSAGLDPRHRLKPSGVEWLGEVPEHWKLTPMRHLLVDGTRNGLYKDPSQFSDDGVPMVQMGEAFAEPILRKSARGRVLVSARELEMWGLQRGDLLVGRRSIVFSGSGKCVLVGDLPEPQVFESSLIRVRPNSSEVDPMYLFLYLSSAFARAQVLSVTKQVTISGVDSQQVKSLWVVLPPMDEQRAALKFLDEVCFRIDEMVEKIEASIDRLQEYRTALITAAVTGNIDVRGAAIGNETVPEAAA